ncbi:hypothetical protein CR201_G0056223 [Pongo abelii]|uniref:Uncharacterized protein n=1 Tax=Pongo abelii TaxID=9601 RepID=A0A2J8Y7U9_PONAB|nr:hypothetical protein CR201_G0056223 [Pongo abelii]
MAAAAARAGSGPWAAQKKQFSPALLSFFIYNPRFWPREGEDKVYSSLPQQCYSMYKNSQGIQNCSRSSLGCSCPCAWSQCWGTCSSSWPSALTPTSTPPCTSFSPTCPCLKSVSPPPRSPR